MPQLKADDQSLKLLRGPMPLYYQVADLMRSAVIEGTWLPAGRLPTENELAVKYGVSRPTIRKAKGILTKEHLIRSVKGSGCFVNGQRMWQPALPTVENLNDIFHHGSKMSFKIHEMGMVSNTAGIGKILNSVRDRFVFQIKGVRWYRNRPLSCAVYYWPFRFGSRIPLDTLDENPFIPQLEKMAGIKIVEGVQNIALDVADSTVAGHLAIQKGQTVLVVRTVYFDEDQQPIEYVETRYRGELPYSIRVKRS